MWQDNIKQYLYLRGMTQEDLALAINVSQSAISGILTSKNKPKLDTLEAIAKTFKVSLSELFSDINEMSIVKPIGIVSNPKSRRYKLLQLELHKKMLLETISNTEIKDLDNVLLLNTLSKKIFAS